VPNVQPGLVVQYPPGEFQRVPLAYLKLFLHTKDSCYSLVAFSIIRLKVIPILFGIMNDIGISLLGWAVKGDPQLIFA